MEEDEATNRTLKKLCGILCVAKRNIARSTNLNISVNTSQEHKDNGLFNCRIVSLYNIIFGRSAMKKFETIASTIHGVVRLKTLDRYGMIHINPLAIPMEMVIEEVKTTTQGGKQAHNETKEVIIHNWYVDQGVQIGEGLSRKLKEALTQLLKESANVFI